MTSSTFDHRTEHLEAVETAVRDQLGVNLHHWTLFRRAINCGTSANPPVLTFDPGFETDSRKDAFLDLGKSNYEVVCCLGFARQALADIRALAQLDGIGLLQFMRYSKEFYFHAGSVLDNLARIIYIVNDANSHSQTTSRRNATPRRRWISWGEIETDINAQHQDYVRFVNDADMQAFRNVRHFLTHVWAPVKRFNNSQLEWPAEITTNRVYAWPHDPQDQTELNSLNFVPVIPMIEQHWQALERFQNEVYEQLTLDVTARFEPNYHCHILPIT